jgi:hypothetical protein
VSTIKTNDKNNEDLKMKSVALVCLLFSIGLLVMSAVGMENCRYSREELLCARIRWFGKEDRIMPLWIEAQYRTKGPISLFHGASLIATIDGQSEMIKTFIEPNKSVDLNYGAFEHLIWNAQFYNEAVQYRVRSTGR